MALITHPQGQYAFLPGIAPYSGGVVSLPDSEIVHVTLARPLPWRQGFDLVTRFLESQNRPRAALCAMELRSPRPFTFAGFAEFNGLYAAVLRDWGLFVEGVNPVARTNVAPAPGLIAEPSLFAFSFTRPAPAGSPRSFIVAGGGELPEGILAAEAIVARGDFGPQGLRTKAEFVMGLMDNRLRRLGGNWSEVTATDVYTVHPLDRLLTDVLLPRMGTAALRGVVWYPTRPPIEEIEFEMDLRGVRTELVCPV
jgi:hypothetical protein